MLNIWDFMNFQSRRGKCYHAHEAINFGNVQNTKDHFSDFQQLLVLSVKTTFYYGEKGDFNDLPFIKVCDCKNFAY